MRANNTLFSKRSCRSLVRLLGFMLVVVWMMPSAMSLMLDSESGSNKVLLCTQNGYEWVTLDDGFLGAEANSFLGAEGSFAVNVEASSNPSNNQANGSMHCNLCLLPDFRDVVISDVYELSTNFVTRNVITHARHADRVSHSIYLHDSPGRAPPFC